MPHISTRVRIVFGLTNLMVSILLLAMALGIVPDRREAVIEGRSRLCEAMAINSSVLIGRDDLRRLQAILTVLDTRHEEILSAGVRTTSGELLIDIGEHSTHWKVDQGNVSNDSQVYVQLRSKNEDWGGLEVRFTPTHGGFWYELVFSPWTRLIAFTAALCAAAWYLFLGRILTELNPSTSVPSRVRSALDTLAEGLLVLDRKGRIVLCNSSLAQTLGQDSASLIAKPASDLDWQFVASVDAGSHEFPWLSILSGEQTRTRLPMRLIDHAGVVRSFQVNCSAVYGAANQVRGVLCGFEDVTTIEAQKLELSCASRAKSDFLANMSHEIRTPMNAILGFTEVLRRGMYDGPEQQAEALAIIDTSGNQLLLLINDILDLSKVEAGHLELEIVPCCPHQIILDVAKVLRVRADEKNLMLSVATPGGLPELIATDAGRLRQVLTNLVGNAIKFTEQGSVKMVARYLPASATGPSAEPMITIEVTDTGVGIAPSSQVKIFEPFTQADASMTRKFGGTGLGLAISKRYIEALGGTLSVRSTLGQGTTFTATFKVGAIDADVRIIDVTAVAKPTATVGTTPITKKRFNFGAFRILVADDAEANRQLIQLVLKREGLIVETVTNGQEAVDRANATAFDVILMDMQMPVLDGYSATRLLRQQGHTLPIVALTANAMKGDEDKCLAAGCSGFQPKPIKIDQLLGYLAEVLGATPVVSKATSHESVAAPAKNVVQPEPRIVTTEAELCPIFEQIDAGLEKLRQQATMDLESRVIPTKSTERPAPVTPARLPVAAVVATPIRSTLADDPEFLEIVQAFVVRLRDRVADLNAAWERRDLPEVSLMAHWLRGAAGTMGFGDFTEPSTKVMRLIRSEQIDEMDDAIGEINHLMSRIEVPTEDGALVGK